MFDFKCPYCGHSFDVDDCYGHEDFDYCDGSTNVIDCPYCEKQFIAETHVHFSFDCTPADCLNGGEHDWQPTTTSPKCMTKMRCTMCGEERNPTPEEREKYGIPSTEEYFREINKIYGKRG